MLRVICSKGMGVPRCTVSVVSLRTKKYAVVSVVYKGGGGLENHIAFPTFPTQRVTRQSEISYFIRNVTRNLAPYTA